MHRILAALLLCLLPSLATAAPEECDTTVEGITTRLVYDPEQEPVRENQSRREALATTRWSRITCPGYITLRHLTPELTDAERGAFCLQYDGSAKTYSGYSQGERDAYLVCRQTSKSVCQRVNATRDTALAVAGFGAAQAEGEAPPRSGLSAIAHRSGAMILTGSGGTIAGALQSAGNGAVAAVGAPAALTAAAVTVVAVGGAVYMCSE